MSEPTPGTLSVGQVFHGRYEIVRCLKSGGMGAVYECVHLTTQKRRALKVMLPQMLANAGLRDRFALEARVTAKIESEHIVETFDAGVDDATGAPFLVMELLRGEDLASLVQRRGPLPVGDVVLLLAQAALALDRTHAAGIVHRDLKPDNLYLTLRDDGMPRLKILDFGIAKVVADVSNSAQQTAMIGTPLYMSQEQILGEGTIGPGADIYAMGHIAFALLTGAAYWVEEQNSSPALYVFLGIVMAGAQEPATARAARRGVTLPAAFDAWFARATARAAKDRFEKVSLLVHELALVLDIPAGRAPSLPFVDAGVRAQLPSLAAATEVLVGPVMGTGPGTGPGSAPVVPVREGSTLGASSKSIAAIPGRSRLPLVAAVGFGAMVVAGVGLFAGVRGRAPGSVASSAAIVAMEAGAPTAVESAAEPVASVAPGPTSSAGVPAVTAVPVQVAVSASARLKTAPFKLLAPAKVCDPPYVIDSSGHRVMKPQCL
jgi:serine/threonine-protein kinase